MEPTIRQFKAKYPQTIVSVVTIFEESTILVQGIFNLPIAQGVTGLASVWKFIETEIWLPLLRDKKPLPMFVFN